MIEEKPYVNPISWLFHVIMTGVHLVTVLGIAVLIVDFGLHDESAMSDPAYWLMAVIVFGGLGLFFWLTFKRSKFYLESVKPRASARGKYAFEKREAQKYITPQREAMHATELQVHKHEDIYKKREVPQA